ncbi:hypothetical protein E2C01_082324 [Portunus trituberculatus]|uniref:Uncharacterized protein n=1 Tax=Portunus trituberculatus TaxID=210409 RepID=A0A5B7IU89_PORTR|nr:hypothetical protein [Portunus trituberculatus]
METGNGMEYKSVGEPAFIERSDMEEEERWKLDWETLMTVKECSRKAIAAGMGLVSRDCHSWGSAGTGCLGKHAALRASRP